MSASGKHSPVAPNLSHNVSPGWSPGFSSTASSGISNRTCSRRSLLKAAVATPLAFGVAGSSLAASPAIDAFVVDRRFWPTGKALPEGMELHFVDGDVTALWYDKLDSRWREPGYVLAGRSGEDVLFVLEQLAWGRGRRVSSRQAKHGIVSWVFSSVHSAARA